MIDFPRGAAFVIVAALALAASAAAQPAANQPYKIGLTIPLTGPLASTGQELLAAAEVGVDQVNRTGGVKGHPLQLAPEDSLATPQGGITAMRKLVQVDGVQAIFTMATNVASAQLPLATELKVPFITIAQAPNLVNQSDYTFAHAQTIPAMIALFRDHWRKTHVKRVYTLVPNNTLATIIGGGAAAAAAAVGAEYASSVFNYGETDYRGLVTRVKDFNPDAILLSSSGGIDDTTIIKQIRELGVTVPIDLSANYYNEPAWHAAIGAYVDNLVISDVTLDPAASKAFVTGFRAKTGHEPSAISAEVYDIVQMYAYAIARGGYNGESIAKQLATLKGVPSVFGGTITVDPQHYSAPSMSLYQIKNSQLVRFPN